MYAVRGEAERLRRWHRLVIQAASTRGGTWILSRWLPFFDLPLLHYAWGNPILSRLLSGLPLLTLTTVGARTGRRQTVPLLFVQRDAAIILIASNWGRPRMPGWYHNLKSNPNARLRFNGQTGDYVAREAEGDERDRAWQRAVELYPGYASYERLADRRIPIFIMIPANATQAANGSA